MGFDAYGRAGGDTCIDRGRIRHRSDGANDVPAADDPADFFHTADDDRWTHQPARRRNGTAGAAAGRRELRAAHRRRRSPREDESQRSHGDRRSRRARVCDAPHPGIAQRPVRESSAGAALILTEKGFDNVQALYGGFSSWQSLGYPTEGTQP